MSAPRLPPLEPSRYEWRVLDTSPSTWQRAALAAENMWIYRPREYHDLFLGGSLTLTSARQPVSIISAARSAWRQLRWEVPELVLTTGHQDDGSGYLQHHVPINDSEISEWVEATLFLSKLQEPVFEDLKEEVLARKGNQKGPYQAYLLVYFEHDRDDTSLVRFMLNVHHQIIDGIGIRILLDKYLSLLAAELGRQTSQLVHMMDWADSAQNLSAPWISIMNQNQVISGPTYERDVAWNQDVLLKRMTSNLGLPLLQSPAAAIQQCHFITLTEDQTNSLLHNIKKVTGPQTTITHLVHASMVLALLKSQPISTSTTPLALFSPCWLNGRRYLKSLDPYIPICQSFAPIIFPDLQSLTIPPYASKIEARDVLIKVTKVASQEYGKLRVRQSMLPESVALMEFLAQQMFKSAFIRNLQRTWLMGRRNQDAPPKTQPAIADPFLLSDGITEHYLSHTYAQILALNPDLRFCAHAEGPNLIVRLSSWRSRTTISGEWRACYYDGEVVRAFLADLVEFMLLLLR